MKKNWRFLLIVLALVLFMLPGIASPAYAEEVAGGEWGEGVTWSLSDTGVLTVSGSGAMQDGQWVFMGEGQPEVLDVPWMAAGLPAVKEAVIEDGITYIGKSNFEGCTQLEKVTIADSVTSMGNGTFMGCNSLVTFDVPANMGEIPYMAFNDCDNLISVTGGESLYSIGSHALYNCPKLESIDLSKINYIGDGAFANCYPLTGVTFSENLYYIGYNAFQDCAVTEVTLPESLYNMDSCVFMLCDELESVTLNNTITEIKHDAFIWCTKLKSVVIPANVTRIDERAFHGCASLTDIYVMNPECQIPNDYFGDPLSGDDRSDTTVSVLGVPGTTTVHGYAGSTAEVYAQTNGFAFEAFPETCEYGYHNYVSEKTAEATCTENGVTTVTCTNCGDSYKEYETCQGHNIENGVCANCGGTFITSGVQNDVNWELDSNGVLTIYTCQEETVSLRNVPWRDYADQVKKIVYGYGIWNHWPVDDDWNLLDPVSYPNLTTVEFGPQMEGFNRVMFDAPNLSEFIIHEDNSHIFLEDGVLYQGYPEDGYEALVFYPANRPGTSYRVPEGTDSIDEYAFTDVVNLEKIYLPESMIYPGFMKDCDAVTDIYILTDNHFLPAGPGFDWLEEDMFGDPAKVTIHGYKDSLAEEMAVAFGHKFVELTECDINGHAESVIKGAKEATCLEEGYSGDEVCSRCEELLTAGSAIPVAGHNLAKTEAVEATCTAEGNVAYWSCTVCKGVFADETAAETLADVTIPVAEHQWDKGTEADGFRVYHCINCDETKSQPLPPEGMDIELPADDETLHESVLNEEEKQRVEAGEPVDVYLDITDISEIISEGEKETINGKLGQHKVGVYLDINLYKQIGNDHPAKVTQTNGKIQISIKVPAQLRNSDSEIVRTYGIIRVHNGVAEMIEGTFDQKNFIFTFETDRFSTYVLTYLDEERQEPPTEETTEPFNPDIPATGDETMLLPWIMLMMVSTTALVLVSSQKKWYM